MLDAWLRTAEVRRWWGDPDREIASLKADLSNPDMAMEIVSFEGRPFAYAQNYEVHVWPQRHFERLPPGARAIDAFIGVAEMVGIGHGAVFLKQLALRLTREGAPVVAIDPDIGNLRARRAYEKAGFRTVSIVEADEGALLMMVFAE